MATKILIKKSSTSGGAPLTSDLDQGELAVNLADRKIYTKNNSNAIVTLDGAYVDSVAPANPAEGDLWYDTTNNILKAHNGSAFVSAGYATLDELENVTITSNSSGEILKWNGSAWVNNTLAEAGIAAASHTHTVSNITDLTATATELNYTDGVTSNIQTQLDGKSSTTHNHTLDSLSNTTITSNSSGEILKWNGSAWVNNTLAEAGIAAASHNHTLDSLSNVTITSNANGEILKWNGSAWVNNTLAEAGIQPAGSYLTAESDTLSSVTGRGATTGNAISITNATASSSTGTGALTVTGGVGVGGNLNVGGNTIITGNLTVNGTTTSVNSNEVNIGDAIILLNSDETGAASQNAGIEIERGTDTNVSFIWNETNDAWDLGNQTLQNVTLDGGSY